MIHSEIFRLTGYLGLDGYDLFPGEFPVLTMVYLLEFVTVIVMPRLMATYHQEGA
jgi:hypothetical protein